MTVVLGGLTMGNMLIARIAHEANAAFCRGMGDDSQPSWDDAPRWQRDSALLGVAFNLAHPEASPAASHDSWLEQKRLDGWSWGPVKDVATKAHPCFLPYDQLPPEQQAKDHLFKAIVAAFRPFVLEA